MKLYEITLQPTSGFGTPLKGDTLFGQFCWQAAHDPELLPDGLAHHIALYSKKPFAIFSSAYPKTESNGSAWFLKRPNLPMEFYPSFMSMSRRQRIDMVREMKAEKWMKLPAIGSIDLQHTAFLKEADLFELLTRELLPEQKQAIGKINTPQLTRVHTQPHNSVNRLSNTTGSGMFSPYTMENTWYMPGIELVLFVLVEESAITIEAIVKGLEKIGKWGFGRDASTGMGRFDVAEYDPVPVPPADGLNALYTLSPCLPEQGQMHQAYFTPFTRFGKHGSDLAISHNPFKAPVIMADEGAIFVPKNSEDLKKQYIGRAVTGVSKAMPETVVQGYSPVLPVKLG